ATVTIAGVRAGSNEEDAAKTFDDDETTAWTSGDDRASAWIEFSLERTADLIDATLKLTGWRERAYPIRILVDGKEAFRGVTPRSLGYVTLPLAIRGRTVRIELIDALKSGDAFG